MSLQPDDSPAGGFNNHAQEEQPQMRSVAFVSSGPPKLTPLPGPPKFGKPPAIGISRPKGGLSAGRTSFTVTQEWTGTVSAAVAATWDVKGEDLEMVPVDFPLERTHREIHCEASEVAQRISKSLQLMSIEAEYDNEKAKAKCKTLECVKFRIRLYAGGDNGQPVVVEVQRRSGSTSCFMRSCRAVLDAAEGSMGGTTKDSKLLAPPSLKSVGAMKSISKPIPGPTPEEEVALAFDSASNLCKSSKYDSVILGLQSLCNLTDPLKASMKTSLLVSKWILDGDDTHTTRDDISALLQLVLDEDDEELAHIFEQQKHYALVVLANALEMCAKDGSLNKSVTENSWIESVLIPALLDAVKDASSSASSAYYASRGLANLLSSSDEAVRKIEESNGMKYIKMAHEFGLQAHDLLASETARCLRYFSMRCP